MLRKPLPGLLLAVLAAPAAAQTVDEVIAKSFEARGGLDRLRAIQTIRVTGRMSTGPTKALMVIERKRPGSFRAEITVQGVRAVQAWDGVTAWGSRRRAPGSPRCCRPRPRIHTAGLTARRPIRIGRWPRVCSVSGRRAPQGGPT